MSGSFPLAFFFFFLTQVLLGNDGHRAGLLNVLYGWPGGVLQLCLPIRLPNKLVLWSKLGEKKLIRGIERQWRQRV